MLRHHVPPNDVQRDPSVRSIQEDRVDGMVRDHFHHCDNHRPLELQTVHDLARHAVFDHRAVQADNRNSQGQLVQELTDLVRGPARRAAEMTPRCITRWISRCVARLSLSGGRCHDRLG